MAPLRRPSRPRRRSLAALAGVLVIVLLVVVGVAFASRGPEVAEQRLTVPVGREATGGAVTLDASVFTTGGGGRRPAVLLAHGFGGSKDDLKTQAETLAADGYVVLTWSARGFGRSGGLIHLDSLDYEVKDAQRLLDLLARRADVQLDAPGDPRVGVAGASYGGALALMLAGVDSRLDAVVPSITWNDLGRALFPQDLVTAQDVTGRTGVLKKLWAGYFFASGSAPGADPVCGRFASDICSAYATTAATGKPTPQLLRLLGRSSPAAVLDGVRAPTLLVQGETDSLFPLSEADATARVLLRHKVPLSVVWFTGGHDAGGLPDSSDPEGARLDALTRAWFDHYLRNGPAAALPHAFEGALPGGALSTADSRAVPVVRVADSYPAGLATGRQDAGAPAAGLPLLGPPQQVAAPPGGAPAVITAVPGLSSLLGAAAGASAALSPTSSSSSSASSPSSSSSSNGAAGGAGAGLSAGFGSGLGAVAGLPGLPGQTAVLATAPLPQARVLLGSSQVDIDVTRLSGSGDAVLFAGLVDVAGDGTSVVLPQRLVSPLRLTDLAAGATRRVTVTLPWISHEFATGHRLVVTVSTTDFAYALPAQPSTYRIAGASGLRLPTASTRPVAGAAVVPAWLLGLVLALLVAAAAVLLWQRRSERHHSQEDEPELEQVPLVVRGLVKDYGHGVRAVDGLSLRVERGMVLGLLGPNGAGKTTTLRMLLGLIRPTAGELLVFGRPVAPGDEVLGRLGAFIEGPGFLPHLSGLDNLRSYWGATGRPWEQAHLDEVLEIAGLGAAVHRRVKTYSQGMRQRLAIAQAMLGLPELLVLDEPTNGLDPPQIREMRRVLQGYAVDGRTVVVSSHLLAEVEATCTDVVVMSHGRAVAAGPVSQLVGAAGSFALEVSEPESAREVLGADPEVVSVGTAPGGLTLALSSPDPELRARLVRALVSSGNDVTGLAPARRLEDVFLSLVEENP